MSQHALGGRHVVHQRESTHTDLIDTQLAPFMPELQVIEMCDGANMQISFRKNEERATRKLLVVM